MQTRYDEMREKHLADVESALRENEKEREKLLALKRLYADESSGASNGKPHIPASRVSHRAKARAAAGRRARGLRNSGQSLHDRKRNAILRVLYRADPGAVHDHQIGERVRLLGVDYPRDSKRPNRSGLDREIYQLRDEGLIARTEPATWKITEKGSQAVMDLAPL
jgi:hypothetical protein